MRALIHDGKGVRLDSRYAAPQAGNGDALVRLKQAAISRDDLNLAARSSGTHGMMGTKFVGVVESVNDRHANLVNKRVVGSPLIYCGVCDLCAAGLRRHCRERAIFGLDGVRGCLADRFAIPARNLLVVPDGVDDDHAVFAADLASALHAAEQMTIVGKPYITVLGDSSLAMLTAQVMVRLNASVRLIGSHHDHLAMCERWGVKHRHVNDIGRRADQDVVVDCTQSTAGLELAMKLVRPRGKVVLKSTHALNDDRSGVDLSPVVFNEIELIGSFIGPLDEALQMLARRAVDVVSLISRRMNLSDGEAIVRTAGLADTLTVIVEP